MNKEKSKIKKILLVVAIVFVSIFSLGYLGLRYLQHELEERITGCKIESEDFYVTLPFEYVNNWIVVNALIAGNETAFPFIFDTGAQTVVLDSLLNGIGSKNYDSFSFSDKPDSTTHAFNNELISLHQLKLDNLSFRDIGAISAKNSKWGMLNCVSAYGIIGYNVLQTFYSQIDYDKKQIILTDNLEKLPNYGIIQWIDYEPSVRQETPIIKATINDSIQVELFFDTGSSGGITLNSSLLYEKYFKGNSAKTAKYISKKSIRIRGENDETVESLILNSSNFKLGPITSKDLKINISDTPEREFTGAIGNAYLENFIITLDYKNKKIGFIPQKEVKSNNTTYGISYVASENKMTISKIYKGSGADKLGIKLGDELYSINGKKVSDLDYAEYCSVYRGDLNFQNLQDSTLLFGLYENEKVVEYELNKFQLFADHNSK